MGDGTSNSQTVANLGDDLRAGEPWQSLFSQTCGIESEVLVEDEKLVVSSSVLVEELLGEEGEVLAIPDIHGEAGAECDPSRRIASVRASTVGDKRRRTNMQRAVPQ